MIETKAREEICRIGKSLFDRSYVHGTAGNISVCLEDGFLITPTDACLGFLDPASLAKLDKQGLQVSGEKASKTMALHTRIYQAARKFDPAMACIIHTHSTNCVALTLQHQEVELIPALTPYFVMKVGHVPVLPYAMPGDPSAAIEVEKLIQRYGDQGAPIRAVMLARLGPNVWNHSPTSAMATLEELEETATLWRLSNYQAKAMSEAQISELRTAYGARW